MYLEGLGFRSIGRLLKVSHVAVMNWVKNYGKNLEKIRNKAPVEIVEIDEMHTYVGKKKIVNGYGLQLIETAEGVLVSLLEIGEQEQGKGYGKR